jgi:hypothetical protein
MIQGSNLAWGEESLLYKTSKLALGVYPTPYLMGIKGTLPMAYSGLGMKPTTHLVRPHGRSRYNFDSTINLLQNFLMLSSDIMLYKQFV